MTALANDFSGGTLDTAITAANSDDNGSGDAFQFVFGAGPTGEGTDFYCRYSDDIALDGAVLVAKLATRAGVTTSPQFAWDEATHGQVALENGSFYIYLTEAFTATTTIALFYPPSGDICQLRILSTGKLQLHDIVGSVTTDSTTTLSTGTWYRIEWEIAPNAVAGSGTFKVRLYEKHSTTLLEPEITRSLQSTQTSVKAIYFGILGNGTNAPTATGFMYMAFPKSGQASATGPAVTEQFARPVADISLGNWTDAADGTTDIYGSLDEVTANDSDYVKSGLSPSSTDVYKLRLGALTNPDINTGHVVRYRYMKDTTGGDRVDLRVKLKTADDSTVIASATNLDIDAVTDGEITLSEAEAAAIPSADYATGLILQFEAVTPAAASGGAELSGADSAMTYFAIT